MAAFSSNAFSAAFDISSAAIQAIVGGANPWHERISKARKITEDRIRKAKDQELDRVLQELRDDGILPPVLVESKPDYSEVRRLYAAQLAQIAENAAIQWQREQDEEDLFLLMMLQ